MNGRCNVYKDYLRDCGGVLHNAKATLASDGTDRGLHGVHSVMRHNKALQLGMGYLPLSNFPA